MIPRHITGSTHCFKVPGSWDEERNGRCLDLHVRVAEGNACASAWEPLPEELEALNRGGSVIITVYGGQPPVSLHVELAAGADAPTMTVEIVQAELERIRSYDVVQAHRCEDELHKAVLRAIAAGTCVNPPACAAAAIKSEEIYFTRFYS
jgi:hypothetical protein